MSDSAEGVNNTKQEGEQPAAEVKAEGADQAAEGFDVVSEGEDTPSSGKGIPLSTFLKNKDKWRGQVKQAKRDAEAVAAENELLRMQLEQLNRQAQRPKAMPARDQYDSEQAHAEAVQQWVDERAAAVAAEAVRKHAPVQQVQPQVGDDEATQKHYERATKLQAPDFEDAENAVIEDLGLPAARQIIEQFDNSEAVMYALGRNPNKRAEIKALINKNPVSAVVALTKYASGLRLQPRGKAPEPDKVEKGTAGATDWQKKLQTLRDRVDSGKAKMGDVLSFKRELRAQGINPDHF